MRRYCTAAALTAILAALAGPACSASSSPTMPASDSGPPATVDADVDGGIVSCEQDPRVDVFSANLMKKSASGALTAALVSAAPAPPALRTNTWTVKLTDAGGAPISGASLSVVPFMPDHGHGSSIVPQITPGDGGTYTIDSLYLFMPGVWRITIGVMPEGGTPSPDDEVQFFFCVEG